MLRQTWEQTDWVSQLRHGEKKKNEKTVQNPAEFYFFFAAFFSTFLGAFLATSLTSGI